MKNLVTLFLVSAVLLMPACKKNNTSERFKLLTEPVWSSDSLIADGVEAGGPGQFLENFNGDAKFREDGTGYFGNYQGDWIFSPDETKLTITTDSLPLPITCNIKELTSASLKITTSVINPENMTDLVDIRMTFKAK